MMKLGLLFLAGLSSVAASASNAAKISDVDVNSMKEQFRYTEEGMSLEQLKHKAVVRSGESLSCEEQEAMYYSNTTAIYPADFTTFAFSYLWADPEFDLQGYFDALNFDSECTGMGGEVYKMDVKISCESGETYLKDYKFCKPPVCDEFTYVLMKSLFYPFLGTFLGCGIELIQDVTPSFECFMGIAATYNETEIALYLPETFIGSGAAFEMTQTGECASFSKFADIQVCNMMKKQPEYDEVLAACEYYGSLYDMDISASMPYMHYTFLKYPYCQPESCTADEITKYYAWLTKMYTSEMTEEEEEEMPTITFGPSVKNSCDEIVSSKAIMKKKKGQALIRNCKWLKKRPSTLKEKFCKKSLTMDGYQPAKEVCPSTCCLCKEDSDDVFLKKTQLDDDGKLVVKKETCGWLSGISESNRAFQCGKSAASYIYGLPPASVACPQTCGTCSA